MRLRALIFGLLMCFMSWSSAWAGHVIWDVDKAQVIVGQAAEAPRYPASITKLMTIHVALDAIAKGRLAWETPVTVSAWAAAAPPVRLGVKAGDSIRLGEAIHAALIRSSNDAARVIAEAVSGSETTFAVRMTETAKRLGMRSTVFRNATGLPDRGQVTTAVDVARLVSALDRMHGKRLRPLFRKALVWNGRTLSPRNSTVTSPSGSVLGKTGFTCDAGFTAVVLLGQGERRRAIVTLGNRGKGVRVRNLAALARGNVPEQPKLANPPVVLPKGSCGTSRSPSGPVRRQVKPGGWMVNLGDFRTRSEAQQAMAAAATAGVALPSVVAVRKGSKGFFALLSAPDQRAARTAEKRLRRQRLRARILPPDKVKAAGFRRAGG